MNHQEALTAVGRRRWMMRQKSKLFKLLRLPVAASLSCPFCRTKVAEGDFFCCSDLEQAWQVSARTYVSEPLWMAQQ